jgi:hypothetical protein
MRDVYRHNAILLAGDIGAYATGSADAEGNRVIS